jgi:hypothetical protein
MSMTGLYKQSLIDRRKKALADVAKLEKSLNSLKNTDSSYAKEHRALLEILKMVSRLYELAPDDLAI